MSTVYGMSTESSSAIVHKLLSLIRTRVLISIMNPQVSTGFLVVILAEPKATHAYGDHEIIIINIKIYITPILYIRMSSKLTVNFALHL